MAPTVIKLMLLLGICLAVTDVAEAGAKVITIMKFPNETFTRDLENSTSNAYTNLTTRVVRDVGNALKAKNSNIIGFTVNGYKNGSIVVNATVELAASVDPTKVDTAQLVKNATTAVATDPTFTAFKIDSSSITTTADQTSTTTAAPGGNTTAATTAAASGGNTTTTAAPAGSGNTTTAASGTTTAAPAGAGTTTAASGTTTAASGATTTAAAAAGSGNTTAASGATTAAAGSGNTTAASGVTTAAPAAGSNSSATSASGTNTTSSGNNTSPSGTSAPGTNTTSSGTTTGSQTNTNNTSTSGTAGSSTGTSGTAGSSGTSTGTSSSTSSVSNITTRIEVKVDETSLSGTGVIIAVTKTSLPSVTPYLTINKPEYVNLMNATPALTNMLKGTSEAVNITGNVELKQVIAENSSTIRIEYVVKVAKGIALAPLQAAMDGLNKKDVFKLDGTTHKVELVALTVQHRWHSLRLRLPTATFSEGLKDQTFAAFKTLETEIQQPLSDLLRAKVPAVRALYIQEFLQGSVIVRAAVETDNTSTNGTTTSLSNALSTIDTIGSYSVDTSPGSKSVTGEQYIYGAHMATPVPESQLPARTPLPRDTENIKKGQVSLGDENENKEPIKRNNYFFTVTIPSFAAVLILIIILLCCTTSDSCLCRICSNEPKNVP